MKRTSLLLSFLLLCTTVIAQETCRISFNLNYDTSERIAPVRVTAGRVIPLDAKPFPVREGHRFGGWYTTPECRPEQEWRFGTNASFYVQATDSMRVENSMTLYAKWVTPKAVRTAEELDAIREDLYGWYVLENDIDLSWIPNWTPIGDYEGDYEFAPGEWWRHAFKGILDGRGHTVKGLTITNIHTDKNGLFGTVANGVIRNLNLEDSRLVFAAERPYVAPLAGILKQDDNQVCLVENCNVTGTLIQVKTTNDKPTFHSFTGLCGGAWGGTIRNCRVSGKMMLDIAGAGGGELYVGAYLGEAYDNTEDCTSDYDIDIHFSNPAAGEYKAYIGGLQASATFVDDCSAKGCINISGEAGTDQLFIGGLVGSERYGTISNSSSTVKVTVSDTKTAQVGGIVGEFNSTYGTMGAAFGVTTTTIEGCSYTGKPIFKNVQNPIFGEISGAGEPAPLSSPWGLSMTYKIHSCTYRENWEASFLNPPHSARPYVWWHWINGNITRDGLRKDLEWMSRIGIGGFHQFDAGGAMMQMVPPVVEPVPYLSNAWKDAFSYAIHFADSLGMEIGIASAPGWSSTGGPWVEPEDAMKKLTWRTMEVSGGSRQALQLPEPYRNIGRYQNGDPGLYASAFENIFPWYNDIAVVAVRIPEEEKSLTQMGASVSSSGGSFTVKQLSNGSLLDGAELPSNLSGTHSWIQYSFPEAVTIRALTLCGGEARDLWALTAEGNNYLLASDDGTSWREVCPIPSSAVQQITITIPETTARYFRLMVVNPSPVLGYAAAFGVPVETPSGTVIHEWVLHNVYKVNHAEEKAGFATLTNLTAQVTPASDTPVQEVIDLTGLMQEDGSLTWDVPAGNWRIYRFGASLTGKQNHPAPVEATGLEVDKLDPDAWSRYFHKYLDMYKDAAGGLLGDRGIQYLMVDSYEAEQMTWTPRMAEAFRSARGYNLIPWLPALTGEIIGSTEETEAFLFDCRETLGKLFAANYDNINDILREYGMKGRYTESHESSRVYVGDGMDLKRTATIPMSAIWTTDLPATIPYQADIRESASVAHIYGQNLVAGETFTANGMLGKAYGWYPGNLKQIADVAMLSGLNRFIIHESAHQPSDDLRPGMGLMIFGQWFNRHETWTEYAKYWMDYLARSSYLLQQGTSVADILWYYGEDTNVTAEYSVSLPDVPENYAYDFASPHILLNCLYVRDGMAITETGQGYKVIALGSHTQTMSIEILRKLHEFVTGGVFVIGKEPVQMAGRGDDASEFNRLVADIWRAGRPNVWTGSVAEGIRKAGVAPDFVSSVPNVRYFHRRDGKRNIYWVRNFSDLALDTEISLRNADGVWTVWDPETGKGLNCVLQGKLLHLEPNQALFIVADPDTEPIAEEKPMQSIGTIRLDGPWTVSFNGQGAPTNTLKWNNLTSWTESSDSSIKYFSGTATYTNTFTLKKKDIPEVLSIDLGAVGQMADISINGNHVAFLWKAPYKVEWRGLLKPGKNIIEVKVVNLWVNRLIGDAQPGAQKRTYTLVPFYQADSPLLPSGLLGPVKIEAKK